MLEAFIAHLSGQPVEVEDPSNRDQCMDLAFAWCDYIGINRSNIRNLYAYQVATHYGSDLVKISSPQPGCFVVFGTSVGPAGHISIYHQGNIQSFDQNWNGHSYAELVNHNPSSVIAYLMPKKLIEGAKSEVLTREQIIMIHKLIYTGREPGPGLVEGWTGKPLDNFLQALWADPTYASYVKSIADLEAGAAEQKLDQIKKIVG
jgi:hypothetical protein